MTKKDNAVPAVQSMATPAVVSASDFAQFEGQGFENVTSQDLIVPRITILQGLSPQVQPKKPEYIKGASVGDLCDVGTNEVFPSPMLFLPVYYSKTYLEWAPRSSGKGLVQIHNDKAILDQTKPDDSNRPILPNGNYISETAQFFGLNLSAGGRRSFIPLTSTQLKKARRWLSLATSERVVRPDGTSFTPPLYYRIYHISTVEEANSKGDWIGFKIERGPSLPEFDPKGWQRILQDAQDFRNSLSKGEMRGDVGAAEEEHSASEGAM
jgi:hypothetical protein